MAEPRYPMKLVAQRTGLSPHVLRVWERRYGAVRPERSESNRRLYCEEEIVRLELMARLTGAGHSIGHIATLPAADLNAMASSLPPEDPATKPTPSRPTDEALLEEAWSCILDLDTVALRAVLDRAAVVLGSAGLATELIIPLVARIGDSWDAGELSAAEEHAASAVIKEVLLVSSRPYAESTGAPNIVVTTPSGQLHELGAVLVACAARRHGWNVTYLGPSLPAPEIARAAARNESLAVGLSIVYPNDDPKLPDELRRLRHALPADVAMLVGGRSATAYQSACDEVEAKIITDFADLNEELHALRAARLR